MKNKIIVIILVGFYVLTICTACGQKEPTKLSLDEREKEVTFKS